jgi:hypothetical protein
MTDEAITDVPVESVPVETPAIETVTTEAVATETAAVATVEAVPEVVVEAAHDAERDTRGIIHRLWDEAEADAEKGIEWFKAEIAKL